MVDQIVVFLHILSAITWIGGTLFLVMVMVPLTRRDIQAPAQGSRLLGQIGRRFRPVAWTAIVILVLTGLYLATERWDITVGDFFGGSGWFIQVLQAKVGLVVIVILLSFFHDFILGPRVVQQLESPDESARGSTGVLKSRRTLIWIARVNLLLVLAIVALSVSLIRGSPF